MIASRETDSPFLEALDLRLAKHCAFTHRSEHFMMTEFAVVRLYHWRGVNAFQIGPAIQLITEQNTSVARAGRRWGEVLRGEVLASEWQTDDERRTVPYLAGDLDRTAVELRQFFGERKSDPAAGLPRSRGGSAA